MLTKIMVAVAAAVVFGTAAMAASENETTNLSGYRESGAGAFATQGINPIFHADSATKCKKAYPKSYDPTTMTFVGKDGVRRPCP
jgi:hypothetical protein